MATLGIDLHALSRVELQRLLDATRSRGDVALTHQLMAEIAARRAEERDLANGGGDDAPARPARWLGLAAGMTAAVLASFGLGWWLHKPAAVAPVAQAAAPLPVQPAPFQPAPFQPVNAPPIPPTAIARS